MSSYFPVLWGPYMSDPILLGLSYKLKVDACEKGSAKERKLRHITVHYLYVFVFVFFALYLTRDRYRYGTMIVFANYLIGRREPREGPEMAFPEWLDEHREITKLLGRRSLD